MLVKSILLAMITACAVHSGAETTSAEQPDKAPPGDEIEDGQHFCCTSVDTKSFSGDGCGAISKENINSCSKVLYCPGAWVKDDGKVICSV
jgi:hypothetical protein